MSEFDNGQKYNNEYTEYNQYNEPNEYVFVITESNDVAHYLTPVEAYTFLTYVNKLLPSIIVLHNNIHFVSLSPEYGTTNYTDSIWGLKTKADPYSIFQYIKSADTKEGGRFEDLYKIEYTTRKAAGEEVYDPFSASLNLNWKSIAKIRKNFIKEGLPANYNKQFKNIKRAQPHGTWSGATPNGRSRKTRSRKTRKNRR
jgi:hypothetical protein